MLPLTTPTTHTRLRSIPTLHFSYKLSKEKVKKYEVFSIDTYIYNSLNMFTHTLVHPLFFTELRLDLLKEASKHLLRKCVLKNDCFSQKREKQQVTDLTAILVYSSLPPFPLLSVSQLTCSPFFPKQSKERYNQFLSWTLPTNTVTTKLKKKLVIKLSRNNTQSKTTGQGNEKLPDD